MLLVVFASYGCNIWCSFGKFAVLETDLFLTQLIPIKLRDRSDGKPFSKLAISGAFVALARC